MAEAFSPGVMALESHERHLVNSLLQLPRIDELIDNLAGNTYFSSLDMRSGYYQVEVEDNDQAKTAFTTGPMGFWEFKRMPFGLTNAPATFQRLMERVMGELHMVDCFTFIDDILVPGKNFPDHLDKLRRVFQKIREHNLKLNPQKCSFFKNKVVYDGHVVSSSGVETDPQKVEKIKHWPVPTDAAKVREFLGFAGYYRRFVKDFSIIAKPLTNLLVGVMGKKGKLAAKSANWKWGEEEQSAFNSLRDRLMSPPILAYPDYERPFVLHVDACASGLGAVLCQESDGMERVISYASRGLSQSERSYPAHKLEFLALKWSVTEKFNDYLYGHEFSVLTDNNPLTYVLTSAKLDATGHRWLAALAAYNFTLKYRPGKSNADADGLSRLANPDRREMSSAAVESLCKSAIYSPWVNVVCFSAQIAKDLDVHGEFNPKDWRKIQLDDPHIFPIHRCVTNGEKLRKNKYAHKETLQLYRSVDNFELQRGVLYRSTIVDGKKKLQLVLPKSYRAQAIRGLHDDMGHLGRDRTLNLLRDRFFWPRMATDVDDWVHKCTRCIMRKTPSHFKAPLVNITSTQPMELVCMDYLSLETSKGGFENILVVVDHFTKYAQAIPTKNQTAKTTANALFNNYFVHYGYPLRLHSDQGANFTGKVISELCKMTGIERSVTTPYHPMGNGVTERFNQTLLNLLGTLDPKEKPDWKSHVGPLVHAYNATKHDSTKHSPFLLMFGREPRLPIDLALGLPDFQEGKGGHAKFIDNLRNTLKDSYQLASQEASKAATRQKTTYDRHARAGAVRVGDRVLVRILAYEGKHKIADKWEPEPCIVVEQADPNIPVYVVQPETGSRGRRTLHRNHLLPIGSLPITNSEDNMSTEEQTTCKEISDGPKQSTDDASSDDDTPILIDDHGSIDLDILQQEIVDPVIDPNKSLSDIATHDNIVRDAQPIAGDEPPALDDEQDMPQANLNEADVDDHDVLPPVLPEADLDLPRRSKRDRRPPAWLRSGDFVQSLNASPPIPDWQQKADYLTTLMKQFGPSEDAYNALINIISKG